MGRKPRSLARLTPKHHPQMHLLLPRARAVVLRLPITPASYAVRQIIGQDNAHIR